MPHVSNAGFEPVPESEAMRFAPQNFDERRVIVHGHEARR